MRWKVSVSLIILVIFATGCWDERLLKDTRIVYLTGIDIDEDEGILVSSFVRDLNIGDAERGSTSVTDILTSASGRNLTEATLNVAQNIAGSFDPATGRSFVIGKELAEQSIFPIFDAIYRDPRVNQSAKIALTDGTANELMMHLSENEVEKAEYFFDLLSSGEQVTEVPAPTLRSLFTYLMDEGRDFVLPYVTMDEEIQMVRLEGSGLFKGHHFTGEYITGQETIILLLLMNQLGKQAILTSDGEDDSDNPISYNVTKVKRDIAIERQDKVEVMLQLHLYVDIRDYPAADLDEKDRRMELEKHLEEQLTKEVSVLFQKLSDNQSDVLGVGRELIAHHPEIWEEIKGDDYYDEINLQSEIDVTITDGGVII